MSTEKAASVAMLPTERRAVSAIASIAMLRMFGLFSLLPVLSLYAASLKSSTPMMIGLAVGAYGLTQAGLQIPFGALSDRVGRVPVIVAGLLIFAIGSLVAGYSDTIYGVILGRLLQGAGAISATLSALIADATREEVRTRSMAFYGVGVGISFLLAMIIGPILSAAFGVRALFWLAAAMAVIAAGLLLIIPHHKQRVNVTSRWRLRPAFRADLLRLDFYVFLLHTILTASFVALPFLLAHTLKMPTTDHWEVYVGALLVSLFVTVPLIMRDQHRGKATTIGIAIVLLLAGEGVLTFAGFATLSVTFGLMLFFAGFNFLEASLPARLSVLADDDVRGASLGVFSSSQFLGAFAGGLLGGRFLASGRPADVFFVCTLLAGLWLALHGIRSTRRNSGAETLKSG